MNTDKGIHRSRICLVVVLIFLLSTSALLGSVPASASPFFPAGAPVAVDDGGPGFTTLKSVAFTTANVLANDHDPDEDPLYVKSFDTTATKGLVSYVSPGSFDPRFGDNGMAATYCGENGNFISYAIAGAIQSDGKIVITGYIANQECNEAIIRYNPDGSLDTSFGVNGIVNFSKKSPTRYNSIAIQSDGKILVAGSDWGSSWTSDFALWRFNANGSLDASFGKNGEVTTDINGSDDVAGSLVIQNDGKILLAGDSDPIWGTQSRGFNLARYYPNGSLDASFGMGGKVITTDFGTGPGGYTIYPGGASAVGLQPDGSILAAGAGAVSDGEFYLLLLAKYYPDGSLDTSFDGDGITYTDPCFITGRMAMAIQDDGKIFIQGNCEYYSNSISFIQVFLPNGSLDTGFADNGRLSPGFITGGLALLPDGRILVAGNTGGAFPPPPRDFVLARFNPDGNNDQSFGTSGKVTTDSDFGGDEEARFLLLQPDGKAVIVGNSQPTPRDEPIVTLLARYEGDGTFKYDPRGQFDWLMFGQEATDTFTYEVSDGALSDTATVTITLSGGFPFYLPIIRNSSR